MAFISITRLRIRSPRYLLAFYVETTLSLLQVKRACSNRGVRVLPDAQNVFWTATAWENEAAMKAYILAGSHRRAMPKLMEWCDEASVVHWKQDTAQLPPWSEAHRRMQAEGRRSKVKHPSPAHTAFEIPAPQG